MIFGVFFILMQCICLWDGGNGAGQSWIYSLLSLLGSLTVQSGTGNKSGRCTRVGNNWVLFTVVILTNFVLFRVFWQRKQDFDE